MVLRDVCGQSPLYMAYRNGIDEALLARLLHYQPQVSLQKTESFSGKTLVESLVRNYEYQSFATPDALWSNAVMTDSWNKMIHTLRAAHTCIFHETQQNKNTSTLLIPELHMALDLWRMDIIGLGLLRNMFVLYERQIKIPATTSSSLLPDSSTKKHDAHRLPLATWVAHCNPVTMKTPNSSFLSINDATATSSTHRCRDSIASFGLLDVLQLLLQADSSAADMADANGQYPLHIALSSTSNDAMAHQNHHPMVKSPSTNSLAAAAAAAATTAVITTAATKESSTSIAYYEQLIHAAPDVLTIPDPHTQLVPFLLAASNSDVDLDTIYTLLREGPHAILSLV